MNTTDKKFTVILSAYQQDAPVVHNLLASDELAILLSLNGSFEVTRAVGCYEGKTEQSFIIHTNSSNTVNELKRLAWDFEQDCILVSSNRTYKIHLHYPDSAPLHIGERFAINNKLAGNGLLSYTVLRGEYWAVI